MAIVKNGAWIAIDAVETDNSLSGNGRQDKPLGLKSAWQTTLNAWEKIGIPPNDPEDHQFYGIKDGVWTAFGGAEKAGLVAGDHVTLTDIEGTTNVKIDVDINPTVSSDGSLDFTK